jgi:hypothetical protein
MLEKEAGCGLVTFDLGWRCVMGSCEHGNKYVGFIKCQEFVS